jgi:hypothetical protein
MIAVYSDDPVSYQVRADTLPVVNLGGAVDTSGLPVALPITDTYMEIHTASGMYLQTGTVNLGTNSWSAQDVPVVAGQETVLMVSLELNYGSFIMERRQDAISGSVSNLNFTLAPVSLSSVPITRTSLFGSDGFLYVPGSSGYFSLEAADSGGGGLVPSIHLIEADTGLSLGSGSGVIFHDLTGGKPYVVQVNGASSYQIKTTPVVPITIGGTVSYSGLPVSVAGIISGATVAVYQRDNAAEGSDYSYRYLNSAAVSSGVWSASVPPYSSQPVLIVLTVNLTNGRKINASLTPTITGPASNLNLAPAPVPLGTWYNGVILTTAGDSILWVPSTGGTYTLDMERVSLSDPYMYLYDGITGDLIQEDDDSGGFRNSRITRTDIVANHPYIINASAYDIIVENDTGTYRLRAAP